MENELILVDTFDRPVGVASKADAHRRPMLHRAFSVFLVDDSGEEPRLLLQKRALCKYHSGGLWTNSCCSHPRRGETTLEAAGRRLEEEMGVRPDGPLREIGSFLYYHAFGPELFEYEYDHVLLGRYRGDPSPDPEEASETAWAALSELNEGMLRAPGSFTPWFFTAAAMTISYLRDARTQTG